MSFMLPSQIACHLYLDELLALENRLPINFTTIGLLFLLPFLKYKSLPFLIFIRFPGIFQLPEAVYVYISLILCFSIGHWDYMHIICSGPPTGTNSGHTDAKCICFSW